MRLRTTARAISNIAKIAAFGSEEWGEDVARACTDRLTARLNQLKIHPERRPTDERLAGFRKPGAGSQMAFQRIGVDEVGDHPCSSRHPGIPHSTSPDLPLPVRSRICGGGSRADGVVANLVRSGRKQPQRFLVGSFRLPPGCHGFSPPARGQPGRASCRSLIHRVSSRLLWAGHTRARRTRFSHLQNRSRPNSRGRNIRERDVGAGCASWLENLRSVPIRSTPPRSV